MKLLDLRDRVIKKLGLSIGNVADFDIVSKIECLHTMHVPVALCSSRVQVVTPCAPVRAVYPTVTIAKNHSTSGLLYDTRQAAHNYENTHAVEKKPKECHTTSENLSEIVSANRKEYQEMIAKRTHLKH
jgi:hypothetical protein